ncbi:MAG: ABC transporter permease [Acidobacteriaceae bacterium]
MSGIPGIISRCAAMFRRHALDRELDDELRSHLEMAAEENQRRGMDADEAWRAALRQFGGVTQVKETVRLREGWPLIENLRRDVGYAVRMLRKSPGFAAIAIGSLALGIGANTAIFSIAKQVLLDRLHVPHPGELRLFSWHSGRKSAVHSTWGDWDKASGGVTSTSFSYPVYQLLRKENHELADLFAFKNVGLVNVTAQGEAEVLQADLVSGNFYQQMEVQPQLGRAIGPADDKTGASPVAIISNGYWTRRFNRSPDVIGKTILVNLVNVTIVGVNPPGFTGAKGVQNSPEIFMPFAVQPLVSPYRNADSLLTSDRVWWMQIMARTKPGVNEAQAQAALNVSLQAAVRATMTVKPDESVPSLALTDGGRGLNEASRQMKQPLLVLMGLVGLVVLLACANLANLLLARSAARQKEMSVRLALGAGRGRILRQVLTESLLLSVFGGVAGLLLGYLGRNALLQMLSGPTPSPTALPGSFNWGVFAFNAALSIATGLLFGMGPAWQATRAQVSSTLKDAAHTTTRRRRGFGGRALVGFQVALSTLLVVMAGVFLRTLINLNDVDPGFDPRNIVLFEMRPPLSEYSGAKQVALFWQLTERLAAVPGVESVTPTSVAPLAHNYENDDFTPVGTPVAPGKESSVDNSTVGDAYFATFRIPILVGRAFAPTDTETSPRVAVVNQALVREYFPNENPIGKSFVTSGAKNEKLTYRIVGVCADTRYGSLREDPPPIFYLDYRQAPEIDWGLSFAVRTRTARAVITPSLRKAVQSVDRNLPLVDVRTQQEQIDELLMTERIFANLTTGFGVLALVLACIGVYGLMAYSVARRTNEIGIRMALGARKEQVMRMVLGEAVWMTALGIGGGLAAALAVGRLIATQLYGLSPWDPSTLAATAGLLELVTLAASWMPASRAAEVDPSQALRAE